MLQQTVPRTQPPIGCFVDGVEHKDLGFRNVTFLGSLQYGIQKVGFTDDILGVRGRNVVVEL